MTNITMQVQGMSCGGCVKGVTRALEALDGVTVTEVALGSAAVAYDPASTSPARISEALGKAGYPVGRVEQVKDAHP
ncbi:MAG: heavy-metal-associated domain-containing protein [Gemmatimonadaceae bacterium]